MLIVAQFHDRYTQVKDNEIVDSGSLKGDRVRYIPVTAFNCAGQLNSKYKGQFLGSCSVTVVHRVTAIHSTGPLYTGLTVELNCLLLENILHSYQMLSLEKVNNVFSQNIF